MGKQLVVKIIELKLTQAFYKDFLVQIIKDNKVTSKSIEKWLKTEYVSWLNNKTKTDELSDIINTKE